MASSRFCSWRTQLVRRLVPAGAKAPGGAKAPVTTTRSPLSLWTNEAFKVVAFDDCCSRRL